MAELILGLDIGGANLKAATPDGRAVTVPFALWKQPERLPAALADLVKQFPDAAGFAVTMTGELCDCFETKRAGVDHILKAVEFASRSNPIRVWGTDGRFRGPNDARREYLTVAAANWHALATFAGSYVPHGWAILIDIGSTTTDIVLIRNGVPRPGGRTDTARMKSGELVYTGVRRTPVCALMPPGTVAVELFATTLDAYLVLGHIPPDPADTDTADGRPATVECAHARLSRMLGGDPELTSTEDTGRLASDAVFAQSALVKEAVARQEDRLPREMSLDECVVVTSGSGEFLVRLPFEPHSFKDIISLADRLGPEVAACAPAYAVAVLATERSA